MQRVLIAFMLYAATVLAQDGTSSPFSKRYVIAQLALEGTDAFFTQQSVCRYGWAHCAHPNLTPELDPLARPFVQSGSKAELAGFFAVDAGVKIGVSYWLHRTGHRKLERWVQTLGIVGSAAGAASQIKVFATDAR